MSARETCDVIVIGGGSAAHEAAVAARYHGARRVVMLEKAPAPESGGNARFSGTGFRFVFEPEEIREIVGLTGEEYARLRIRPYTADDFLGDLRRVTRDRIDLELAAVLVGESNEAVRWSREVGMRWQLGDGIEVDGLRYFQPGIPIHPLNLGGGRTNGLSQLVQWQRIALAFGGIETRYDSKVTGFLGDAKHPMTFMPDEPVFAGSIAELAGKIGVDPVPLGDTVEKFNAAIDTSAAYDRTVRDGRRTTGLSPDKSNWALSLDTPPYFAVPVTGGITFTFGGVKVDTSAQVIATGGRPVPGLYASGDLIGLFFHNYPSMTGQTRNLVFSLRAAASAVR
jgi:succinate dehydrogenase/fumarate reductase flavoprotein subunit